LKVRRHPDRDYAIGIGDRSVISPASFAELIYDLHAGKHFACDSIFAVHEIKSAYIIKDCLLAELGSLVRAMPTMPR
jgi:hypothetical protein